MRKYFGGVAIWVASILIVVAVPYDMPVVTWLAIILFLIAGLLFAIILLVVLVKVRKKRQPAIALLLVVLVLAVSFNGGFRLGAYVHLLVNQARYTALVTKLLTENDRDQRETICGDICVILSDDPLRVGFHFCHGFLNWIDIVYDPTGAVTERRLPPERALGIYHVGGKHLKADWYIGYFAD